MDELIVFVRIGLYIAAGRLISGGWMPPEVSMHLTSPEAVEAVSGLVLGAVTTGWYLLSKARRSLRGR